MIIFKASFRLPVALILAASALTAQTMTGSITGSVLDISGFAVPGAAVSIVNPTTGATYRAASRENGEFVFTSLSPGQYTLTLEQPGFKKIVKNDLNLTQSDRLSAGKLVLEVGNVANTLTPRQMQFSLRYSF